MSIIGFRPAVASWAREAPALATPPAAAMEHRMQQPMAFHLLAKPTGASCNLDCKYCFFLSKDRLYGGATLRMADDVLEAYVSQLLAAQPHREVNIAWQGGEPPLMGLDFFRRSIDLVAKYRKPGQKIVHSIQTK